MNADQPEAAQPTDRMTRQAMAELGLAQLAGYVQRMPTMNRRQEQAVLDAISASIQDLHTAGVTR